MQHPVRLFVAALLKHSWGLVSCAAFIILGVYSAASNKGNVALIGGSVVIETIFSIPGMGQLGFQSVLDRDYPLIMAIFTLSALLTLMGILIADFLYTIVDPRIAYERQSA